jgi:hypothetical protein
MSGFYKSDNWNENNLNPLSRINWRASLVPAAAVIPAPIAYTKVVAVKKLVVEFLVSRRSQAQGPILRIGTILEKNISVIELMGMGLSSFTVSKIECSKQAYAVEYISME